MIERLCQRCGEHYILVMMLLTRVVASIGACLTVYYIELTLSFDAEVERHFLLAAAAFVAIGISVSTLLALWLTRDVRRVLAQLRRGETVDALAADRASRQLVHFPARQCFAEAFLDPVVIVLPLCGTMWWLDSFS